MSRAKAHHPKRAVATFVKDAVSDNTLEKFEDAFSGARESWDTWYLRPTRSAVEGNNVTQLARLCKKVFSSEGVPYNADLFFILDERTERDHSACLVHHTVDPASGHVEEKQMRVSAGFAPLLLSNLEIAHLVIPGITDQVSETASEDDSWLESTPSSPRVESALQQRIAASKFTRQKGPGEGFSILTLTAKDAGETRDIEFIWFGKPPESILMLKGKTMDGAEHVVGEMDPDGDDGVW
ncbi:unnamed protein product [Peniophora sp. CBMAI 1063]|nr:unnamed protein product [Peniophora sp. CBMAI 1063]